VRLSGVVKRFGETTVLDHLDLDVAPGSRLAIIGPSGSGKSTLLRIVMALEGIDAGEVRIAGESLWTMERKGRSVPADEAHLRHVRRHVGMVFQHFNLFPHMNVLDNITEAPVRVRGLDRSEAERSACELLERVGLGDRADAYPSQLSGGQKQRVAIARALAMQPDVMLFDEVTSALDPELVGEVLNVLRMLATETETTMMIVTHEIGFARDIADRVVFMDGGRVVEDAPPDVIFNAPSEPRTRQFLQSVLGD
jgi:polar amino acid transport system ATP-binding protein